MKRITKQKFVAEAVLTGDEKESRGGKKPADESASVIASFVSRDGVEHALKIKGRGNSVMGKVQGDHVTAYGLIERGITRSVSDIKIAKAEDWANVVEARGRLYEYVIKMMALSDVFGEKLIAKIKTAKERYDSRRFKKTNLASQRSDFESLSQFKEKIINDPMAVISSDDLSFLSMLVEKMVNTNEYIIEKAYISNSYAIFEEINFVARSLMTFYNTLPFTAFPRGSDSAGSRGEQGSLNQLEMLSLEFEKLRKSDRPPRDVVIEGLIREAASNMERLFFYPMIDEETSRGNEKIILDKTGSLLEAWRVDNGFPKGYISLPRTNELETLMKVLGRHVNIICSVYNEIGEYRERVKDEFIEQVFDKQWWEVSYDKKVVKSLVAKELKEFDRCYDHLAQKGIEEQSSQDEALAVIGLGIKGRTGTYLPSR